MGRAGGAENPHHDDQMPHEIYDSRHVVPKNPPSCLR